MLSEYQQSKSYWVHIPNRITFENIYNVLKTTSMKNIANTAVSVSFCFQKQYESQEKSLDLM